ncbi:ATP-dependent helicase/nuclease subunit A [Frankliniella fusca]|uniref:ATP-dependent helicase/nuclease subunit A n=1 Tax=Frankliniella fusca TaxID=407009 RepID=A0AAE1LG13_9NEOP|nr:ATP-dependent helicase/nuclease subunit A [Frankliniella fusca]
MTKLLLGVALLLAAGARAAVSPPAAALVPTEALSVASLITRTLSPRLKVLFVATRRVRWADALLQRLPEVPRYVSSVSTSGVPVGVNATLEYFAGMMAADRAEDVLQDLEELPFNFNPFSRLLVVMRAESQASAVRLIVSHWRCDALAAVVVAYPGGGADLLRVHSKVRP